MTDDHGTGDGTGGARHDPRRETPKLTVVGGDSAKGPGGRFQRGNQEQRKGHGRAARPHAINMIPQQLDQQAKRVVRDLFRSVNGGVMTAPVANAIIVGLRLRNEIYGSYTAAEELQRLHAALATMQARFQRLKAGLGN